MCDVCWALLRLSAGYILIECGYMFAIAPDQLQMNLVDIVIIHGIVLLDVLDKELITYAIRVR